MSPVLLNSWIEPFLADKPAVSAIVKRLALVPGAAYVAHNVPKPENLVQHTDGMIKIVERLKYDLVDIDLIRLCQICFVHEWPAVMTGDDKPALMRQLCDPLGAVGVLALDLYLEFAAQATSEGQFARQLDLYQAMEKTWLYQRLGYGLRTADFIKASEHLITHPVLTSELRSLKSSISFRGYR